jgi:phosphoribosyl 1,2-cyclic phosphate phosphodiesterase
MQVLGLVFEERSSGKKIAYYTDCKEVGPEQRELARSADIVILDALRPNPHPTHMSIEEALETALDIGAPQTYFTHMTFMVDHETYSRQLPQGVSLAYDGLRISL